MHRLGVLNVESEGKNRVSLHMQAQSQFQYEQKHTEEERGIYQKREDTKIYEKEWLLVEWK